MRGEDNQVRAFAQRDEVVLVQDDGLRREFVTVDEHAIGAGKVGETKFSMCIVEQAMLPGQ